jgi:hypothetical protein
MPSEQTAQAIELNCIFRLLAFDGAPLLHACLSLSLKALLQFTRHDHPIDGPANKNSWPRNNRG